MPFYLSSKSHAEMLVKNTNQLLGQINLLISNDANVPLISAQVMQSTCATQMDRLKMKIQPIADKMSTVITEKVQQTLAISLKVGAQKGKDLALDIIRSWGSKNRRTKNGRGPHNNGEFVFQMSHFLFSFSLPSCRMLLNYFQGFIGRPTGVHFDVMASIALRALYKSTSMKNFVIRWRENFW